MDSMSGLTSQPSMGAIVGSLRGTELDTGLNMDQVTAINEYWEECRGLYAPFESGQKSGSADVYDHEMPGGQYTNLLFQVIVHTSRLNCNVTLFSLYLQSQQLGLSGRWPAIKKAYASANRLLGDIIKVRFISPPTPRPHLISSPLFFPSNVFRNHRLLPAPRLWEIWRSSWCKTI